MTTKTSQRASGSTAEHVQQLQDMATLLRRDSLRMTTAAGSGHPTTCLSCAELMAALFFDELRIDPSNPDCPEADEFVLSKGHGAPILYAALHRAGCCDEDPMTLRQLGSPYEGHPLPSTLPWVKVATGSLGQGLSVGVGMAIGARRAGRDKRIYVLQGDSETAEGCVWEAVQIASHLALSNLCLVLDVNRLGQSGPTMLEHDLNAHSRRFEAFGWNTVVGDGHDMEAILRAFQEAREETKAPTAILAKTFKGRGVSFLEDEEDQHGKPVEEEDLEKALAELPEPEAPDLKVKRPAPSGQDLPEPGRPDAFDYSAEKEVATRGAYGNALARLAKADPLIMALDGEVSNSTKSEKIREENPEQYVECYIAEQNMVGMGLGLSALGFRPCVSTFATFLTRAHDQLRMASLSSADMVVVGSHAGVSIGEDGPSQMGLDDIAMFRGLFGSTVLYPADAIATERALEIALKTPGISYIRTSRPKTPIVHSPDEPFRLGEFKVLRQSSEDKAVLVGAGVTLHEALRAHDTLREKHGISTAVVDCWCIRPFDGEGFCALAERSGGCVVVAEDHVPEGGIGEMISQATTGRKIRVISLAVRELPHSGTPEELLAAQGIDASGIAQATKRAMDA